MLLVTELGRKCAAFHGTQDFYQSHGSTQFDSILSQVNLAHTLT